MRTLSASLTAAQKAASFRPFMRVKVTDKMADVLRLRFTRLYDGSETDAKHCVTIPIDGSLLRIRIDPAGPTAQYSRVTSPDAASDYSSWSSLGSVANADVALTANGANVALAIVQAAGTDMYVTDSSNNGESFGAAVLAASLAGVTWLALALKSDGDAMLFYSDGTSLYTARRTSTVWQTPIEWGKTPNTITGIAVALSGDFHVVIAGTDSDDNPAVWTSVFGDGVSQTVDTWSTLLAFSEAADGSGVTFSAPSISYMDTARIMFLESYSGTVAYTRPFQTWFPPGDTFTSNSWREPVPFNLSTAYGMAIVGDATHAWLTTPDGVWRAPFDASSLAVTDDVLELKSETRRTSGGVKITLRNHDGRYNNLSAGNKSVIRRGAQVEVKPGLLTGSGEEVSSPGLKYWIDRWEHTSAGGEASLIIHASDAWALIERWRARRQHTWAAGEKSAAQILSFIVARAGFELLNIGISILATNYSPDFTVHPGDNGLSVIQRLLSAIPDTIRLSDSVAFLTEETDADSSVYTYGADHAIYRGRYDARGLANNRIQVFGDDKFAEQFDWDEIDDEFDYVRQVFDLNLTTQANVEGRAVVALRIEHLDVTLAEIVTPVNCGSELYDVVTITDEQAGISSVDYRVIGQDLHYIRRSKSRGKARYEQRLLLGNV